MIGLTGIVLAGGRSRRLGRDKAAVRIGGETLLDRAVTPLWAVCDRVLVVVSPGRPSPMPTNRPNVETVADIQPGRGPLGGLHTGLEASFTRYSLLVGCDMPFLNTEVLRFLADTASGWQAVVPRIGQIPQTLHAVYSRECLPAVKELLGEASPGLVDLLPLVRVRYVEEEELLALDPELLSFFNVNTQDDLRRAKELLEDVANRRD